MRRFTILSGLALVCGLAAVLWGLRPPAVTASARAASAPAVECVFTTLSFTIGGQGPIEGFRSFTPADGETYLQFVPAPPITATTLSAAAVEVNNGFAGTLSQGLNGTFVITGLNGLAVNNSVSTNNGRGFQIGQFVINGSTGTITSVLAYNWLAFSSSSPYYPRSFQGYLVSTETSGSYAAYRYAAYIVGGINPPIGGGGATINAQVAGRLYNGAGSFSETAGATRNVPPNHAADFQPGDLIAQFRRPDFQVGGSGTVPGHVTPRSTFAGTIGGTINGGFLFDHEALVLDSGPNSGKGWLVGNFNFVDAGGDFLTGPFLADVSNNNVTGLLFQTAGSGVYTDSLLFANFSGLLTSGGANLFGQMSGSYCASSSPPSATPSLTPQASPTQAATLTSTATPTTPAATTTQTATPQATSTPAGTATAEPSATTAPPTATPPAVTSTATQLSATATQPLATPTQSTSTSTSTTTAVVSTATPTVCTVQFEDVPPSNTFYPFVRCLACRNIIGGYPCGGAGEPCNANNDPYFRPGSSITRGQLSKIVSNSAGFSEPHSSQTYTDVPLDSPFYIWIERLSSRGVMGGYPCGGAGEPCDDQNRPYFRPGANVSRGQTSKIVSNADNDNTVIPTTQQTYTDVEVGSPFWVFIERLSQRGIMGGYPCGGVGEPCDAQNRPYFRPGANVTRGQASKIDANTFFPGCQTP